MTIKNLTPKAMRCAPLHCPSVHQFEDGRLLIVGEYVPTNEVREMGANPDPETEGGVIISPALLDDVPRGWRTIDSAPRDGTSIILAVTGGINGPVIGEARWHYADGGDWWWAGNAPGDYHGGPISEINFGVPTHWQPLPLPPTDREGS